MFGCFPLVASEMITVYRAGGVWEAEIGRQD